MDELELLVKRKKEFVKFEVDFKSNKDFFFLFWSDCNKILFLWFRKKCFYFRNN